MFDDTPTTIAEVLTPDELERIRSIRNLPVPVGFDPPTSGTMIEMEAETRALIRENLRAWSGLQANLALKQKLINTADEATKLQLLGMLEDYEAGGMIKKEKK